MGLLFVVCTNVGQRAPWTSRQTNQTSNLFRFDVTQTCDFIQTKQNQSMKVIAWLWRQSNQKKQQNVVHWHAHIPWCCYFHHREKVKGLWLEWFRIVERGTWKSEVGWVENDTSSVVLPSPPSNFTFELQNHNTLKRNICQQPKLVVSFLDSDCRRPIH